MDTRLFFVGLPLLLIFVPTFINMACQRKEKCTSRIQMLIGFITVYSMSVFVLGLVAMYIVSIAYQEIPGTASQYVNLSPRDIDRIRNYPEWYADPEGTESLRDGGQQYFYSTKRSVFTPVSKKRWRNEEWPWFSRHSASLRHRF